jgi:hypothetical protein
MHPQSESREETVGGEAVDLSHRKTKIRKAGFNDRERERWSQADHGRIVFSYRSVNAFLGSRATSLTWETNLFRGLREMYISD